jgi:hypothetical protein
MKNKEEIEKSAETYYTEITLSQRTAFKLGYFQCYEDMKEDFNKNRFSISLNILKLASDSRYSEYSRLIDIQDYIKSLNKKENE